MCDIKAGECFDNFRKITKIRKIQRSHLETLCVVVWNLKSWSKSKPTKHKVKN